MNTKKTNPKLELTVAKFTDMQPKKKVDSVIKKKEESKVNLKVNTKKKEYIDIDASSTVVDKKVESGHEPGELEE